jgi:hypothetical protein
MANRFINIRKFVALEILLHGRLFILIELGIAAPLLLAFGLLLITSGLSGGSVINLIPSFYLVFTGVNYICLLFYAIIISAKNSAKNESESEFQHKSKYNFQQFLILIPLIIFLIAVWQELKRFSAQ